MNTIYLAHHGIKGQRWGVRRYQNSDGSPTSLGQHYKNRSAARNAKIDKQLAANKEFNKKSATATKGVSRILPRPTEHRYKIARAERAKRLIKAGMIATATSLAAGAAIIGVDAIGAKLGNRPSYASLLKAASSLKVSGL